MKGERLSSTKEHTWQKVGETSRKSADAKPPTQLPIKCPECGSLRVWKDGLRYARSETGGEIGIQRFICRDCRRRFSEDTALGSRKNPNPESPPQVLKLLLGRKPLRRFSSYSSNCQVCVQKEGMKNLARVESRVQKQAEREATKLSKAEIKGKLVEFMWHLKKEGYAESTVRQRTDTMRMLLRKGVDIMNPDSVKTLLATQDGWSKNYKLSIVNTYDKFLEMLGIRWQPPNYKPVEKLPFIPHEEEIDALISGCGKKMATTLQLLKETGMRIGEAWNLEWIDIDEERRTIRCQPEKGGRPRMFKVSHELIAMLKALPKENRLVFAGKNLNSHQINFLKQRRRLAEKLKNPRLEKVTFHTLRHWKATMEYHKTKDIIYVKQLLGHKKIENTMKYTQLVNFEDPEEFTCRVTKTVDGAKELIEAGFEYVTDVDDTKLFRKRK